MLLTKCAVCEEEWVYIWGKILWLLNSVKYNNNKKENLKLYKNINQKLDNIKSFHVHYKAVQVK